MGRKITLIKRAGRKQNLKEKTPKSASKRGKKSSLQGATAYVRLSPAVGVIEVEQALQKKELKTTRYEIRFTPQQQEMMEKASSILGYKNATDYIRHVMQESATKVIKEQILLQIAEQDRQRFMKELMNPSEPSKAFKRGVELFNKTFKD